MKHILVRFVLVAFLACGGGCDSGVVSSIPAPRSGMKIGTNFWDLTFRGGATWNDVFRPDVDFSTTADPWNPLFLEEVRHYRVLRFMDFGKINGSGEKNWEDRTQKTDARPTQERVAYEWMIDLCNRTGADMWVNLPAGADDNYALELAKLIAANLNSSLKVYVEWSNETWNSNFDQYQYAIDQGMALGLDSNPKIAGAKFHVYRALRIFSKFNEVFGATSPRVIRVIAGQASNTYLTSVHLAAISNTAINPNGLVVNAYAIAPYFGHRVDGGAVDTIDQLVKGVANAISEVRAQYDLIAPTGMQLVAYEGGQHVTTHADIVNARPEMYSLYTAYLDGLAPYLTIFGHYVHNGQWGARGSWGAESYVGQPLSEAHKLRAIFDWIAAHP